MLPLPSGSDFFQINRVFRMDDPSQVGESRRFALLMCDELAFAEVRKARVGIVINELGNNLVKYAQNGRLLIRSIQLENLRGLEVLSIDSGPGLENTSLAMTDGYTTGSTPGTGLGAVRRQSDLFDLFSVKDKGTIVLSMIYSEDPMPDRPLSAYEVAAISVPVAGETVCGDGWSVITDGEKLRAMVVDGLGHGPQAYIAAQTAVSEFQRSHSQDQMRLVQLIHGALKSTRGAAIFLVSAETSQQVESSGVGNIRAFIQGAQGRAKSLISQNGTAGLQMRTVKPMATAWEAPHFLILHSDGLSTRWDLSHYPGLASHHPAIVAAVAYRDFLRGNDDATILVLKKVR